VIRVLIAEDHGVVRAGLTQLLSAPEDLEVVAAAGGGQEAVELARAERPAVVLMDLSMPDMDGVAATRAIAAAAPEARVVMLTSFSDRARIMDALDAGAIGYMLKDAEPEEIYRGVRAAARGESPLDPKAAQALIAARATRPPEVELTDRERDVLALIAEGRANKVIARRLGISEKTVKNHVTRILQALDVTDRTQAALWAQRHGIGPGPGPEAG
jgi:DNA-binding NarL/FixJ family response regulator